jgi:hypothetical protein
VVFAIGQGVEMLRPGRSIGIDDAVRLFGSSGGRAPPAFGGGFRLSGIGFIGAAFEDAGSPNVFFAFESGISGVAEFGDDGACGGCVEDGGSGVGGIGPGKVGAISAELVPGLGGARVGDGWMLPLNIDGLPGTGLLGSSGIPYVGLDAAELGAAGTMQPGAA